MDLGTQLGLHFATLHWCSAACTNPCVTHKRVSDYIPMVRKVCQELNGKAAFRQNSTDDTIMEIYRVIITRIWVEQDLENADLDRTLTPANVQVWAAARVIVKECFQAHPNFLTWIV